MKLKLEKKDGSISVIETIAVTFSDVGFCYFVADHTVFMSHDDYKLCSIIEE